jgi:hypothetical protein
VGQQFTFTGLARGDVYHSTDNALTTTSIYQRPSRLAGARRGAARWT